MEPIALRPAPPTEGGAASDASPGASSSRGMTNADTLALPRMRLPRMAGSEVPARRRELSPLKKRTPQEAADLMFQLLREGGQATAEAARLMDRELGRWMDHYFRRFGVPDHEAEELTMDVWVKVFSRDYDVKSNGFALLCRMRKSRLADYIKHRRAAKRSADVGDAGGEGASRSAEIALDDEAWDHLRESIAGEMPSFELSDCVQRKMVVYQQVSPARAELLELVATGLSYREMACIVFDVDDAAVTQQLVNRIRNRIEEARKQAAQYFEECKE